MILGLRDNVRSIGFDPLWLTAYIRTSAVSPNYTPTGVHPSHEHKAGDRSHSQGISPRPWLGPERFEGVFITVCVLNNTDCMGRWRCIRTCYLSINVGHYMS